MLLGRLSALNLAALPLIWAAETGIGERHWLTTILAYAPQHPLIVPALGLLAWSLWKRRWRLALVNTAAAAFAFLALMGAAWPVRAAVAPAGPRLRVMTLNIHHAASGVAGVATLVREAQPDLFCAQEANGFWRWEDPTPALARLLPEWRVVRAGDVATFSRLPIRAHRAHEMPGGDGRNILETVHEVGGKRVTVLNAHFDTASHPRSLLRSLLEEPRSVPAHLRDTARTRLEQAAMLLTLVEGARAPLLVAGDFNTPPRGRLYGRLARPLRDSFRASGRGLGSTFRADVPVLRIDYVWAGAGVTPLRCFVPGARVSDHRAVIADLAL